MQKKIIALAVAGLVSGAAFAQSNVTIYGIMDVGVYGFSGNDESSTGIQSSGLSTSRLGFKGEEALGNGLKAVFNLETGIDPDNKGNWSSDRQANVGLSGNFGTILLGIQPSLSDNWHGGVSEPMGNISSRNIIPGVVGGFSNEKADAAAYYSPVFSGLQLGLLYGTKNDTARAGRLLQTTSTVRPMFKSAQNTPTARLPLLSHMLV
jgi:predicted porin